MRILNKIEKAFGEIKAEEKLKNNTLDFLAAKRAETSHRPRHKVIPYVLAAAAVIMVTFAVGIYEMWFVPVTVISIDVNPSVEFTVNRLDRIMAADAYNDDGTKILQSLSVDGMRYDEGIACILNDAEFSDYLSGDSLLTFTVASEKEDAVMSRIHSCLNDAGQQGVCVSASSHDVEQAHSLGLSLGKYQVYLELQQYDPGITADECHSMTMKELRDLMEELSKENGGDSQSSQSYGQHHRDESGYHGEGHKYGGH